MKWGDNSKLVKYDPGPNYIGSSELFKYGQLRQFSPLYYDPKLDSNKMSADYIDGIRSNIKDLLQEINNYKTYKYHIVRLSNGDKFNETIFNIKKEILNPNSYNFT